MLLGMMLYRNRPLTVLVAVTFTYWIGADPVEQVAPKLTCEPPGVQA
jgi:hypothetical protein